MRSVRKPLDPILVVDDEESILLAIDTTLQMAGFNNIVTCSDSRRVGPLMAARTAEIVLLDLTMPHVGGEELLALFAREYPDIPVIIITGAVDVDTAVGCMRAGAFDYVVKPVEEDRLVAAVRRAVSFRDLKRENQALKAHIASDALEHPSAFRNIITQDKKMLSIFQYVESIAGTSQPVLIRGETGVGKELVAIALHRLSGLAGQFVAVNVGGLDDNVFSDTLFGHVKGAFTGAETDRCGLIEQASGGTLFLDEIGDLSPASQVKLLRLLQEGEYMALGMDMPTRTDARIVTSTNLPLRVLQKSGRFRQDLDYRLRTHQIYIPPLRDRMGDLPLLVDHFLARAARVLGKATPAVPRGLLALLSTHAFEGNVRELESMIFDAVSRHKAGALSLNVFRAHVQREAAERSALAASADSRAQLLCFSSRLPTIKKATELLVAEAIKRAGGNQTAAARMLGISQQALSKRLKQQP